MINEITILLGAALLIGFVHTILGPDHYLPFLILSKARKWTGSKMVLVTVLCGTGHVLSSLILGFIGVVLGIAVFKLDKFESIQSVFYGWLLITFGFVYFVWGLHKAIRLKPHEHLHLHKEGEPHAHLHRHFFNHSHPHIKDPDDLTPWILFVIFIFGPCEPLIPLVMYSAVKYNLITVGAVSFIFALATILTMLCVVFVSSYGLSKISFGRIERYSHAFAGLVIFLCGISIKFLGL